MAIFLGNPPFALPLRASNFALCTSSLPLCTSPLGLRTSPFVVRLSKRSSTSTLGSFSGEAPAIQLSAGSISETAITSEKRGQSYLKITLDIAPHQCKLAYKPRLYVYSNSNQEREVNVGEGSLSTNTSKRGPDWVCGCACAVTWRLIQAPSLKTTKGGKS